MGKVDQGVFTLLDARAPLRSSARYIGYGGTGKQVRDLLHVEDLIELLDEQLIAPERWDGVTVNVGGGRDSSLSLCEATALCARSPATARDRGAPTHGPETCRSTSPTVPGWKGSPNGGRGVQVTILTDIHSWIGAHESALSGAL